MRKIACNAIMAILLILMLITKIKSAINAQRIALLVLVQAILVLHVTKVGKKK